MDETVAPFQEEPSACPFVALEDDRDRRSDKPDYRHRCFASRQPEPRAFPHQERYCLARGFTECPIFLDWARRESAAVVPSRRSRPQENEDDDVLVGAATQESEAEVPAFLAASRRPSGRGIVEDEEPQAASAPEEGLWGPNDPNRQKRGPIVAKARANVKHPDWEEAPRQEQFPRLRSRGRLPGGGGGGGVRLPWWFTAGVVFVALALVAFLVLPGILFPTHSGVQATPTPVVTVRPSATPSPTAVPKPTPTTYTVKPGDTLTSISTKFGVSIDDILTANPQIKNPDDIHDGDVLNIPAPTNAASPSPTKKP